MTLRVSKSTDGLAQRIVVMLTESGPRQARFFRSFAASEAIFEQAIGRLFILGQAKFTGSGKGRKLARVRRV